MNAKTALWWKRSTLNLEEMLIFPTLACIRRAKRGEKRRNAVHFFVFALWFEIRQILIGVERSQSQASTAPSLPGKSHQQPMAAQRSSVLFRSIVWEANAALALFCRWHGACNNRRENLPHEKILALLAHLPNRCCPRYPKWIFNVHDWHHISDSSTSGLEFWGCKSCLKVSQLAG